MSRSIVAFVDHEIGFRLLGKLFTPAVARHVSVAAVVTTQENGHAWWPGVAEMCADRSVPLFRYGDGFEMAFKLAKVDWYFLLSWKHIMPRGLLDRASCGTINLHYSLLPEYRGVYPVNWAIIDGRKETGVTYHLVDDNVDGGMPICQKRLPISLHDTARSLQLRLDDLAYALFDDVLQWIETGRCGIDSVPRGDGGKGCYKSRQNFEATTELDLQREYRALDLLNLMRGMSFLPDSRNLFFVDPETGRRVYVSVKLDAVED